MRGTGHPPSPGTGHPAYAGGNVEAIRWWLDNTDYGHAMLCRGLAVVYECESSVEVETATSLPANPSTRLLHRQLAATPAPWAGRPFAYIYSVAVDDLGRAVAGVDVEPYYLDRETIGQRVASILGVL